VTTVYFAGGEDDALYRWGPCSISTNGGDFRSGYARCALIAISNAVIPGVWRNYIGFSAASFWFSARVISTNNLLATFNGSPLLTLDDSSRLPRLQITGTGTASTYRLEKVTTAGAATQLGANFQLIFRARNGGIGPSKLDVVVTNYASGAGTISVYLEGVLAFTFTGDLRTDTLTQLSNFSLVGSASLNTVQAGWSEIMVLDVDTRSASLGTLAPVANGNTHDFDVGTPDASNVNGITANDAVLDGSTTAGQIDEYRVNALPAGTFSVLAVGVSARSQKGFTGPTKEDLIVRTGGTDYFSADKALDTSWWNYHNWWTLNPNTGVAWLTSDVNDVGFNIGIRSVA